MRSAVTTVLLVLIVALVAGGAWLWTPDKSRAELEARYLNAASDYVDVAGMRLHVRGSGPENASTVIFLHGLGSSLHTWEPWAKLLSAQFRVVRYDLPGFGLTGSDPTGDYTDARGMRVLTALMDKLAIEKASLIGNSIGGRLAWNFAAQYPERVAKLVLIAPDGFASPGYEYGKTPEIPFAVRVLRYVLPKFMLRMNLAPAYGDPTALNDAMVSRYYDLMLAPGVRDAMIRRMEQVMLFDPEPVLARITAATLLLWGEKDAMIPVANAADYLRAIPESTLKSLPGLGHVPHEEAPDRSLEPVAAFLAK